MLEYKTVDLRTEKGIKEAEELKEQGWTLGSHGLDTIQFYRELKKEKTYDFYEDAGHGWLKVKLSELIELEIAEKISGYSYYQNDNVYLEEDCDMNVFLKAMRDKKSTFVKFRDHFAKNGSRVRSYDRFSKKYLTKF